MSKRPYPPAKVAAKGKRAGTEKLVSLIARRFRMRNLGTWVVRDMRGKPGVLSVHATGRAFDLGYSSRADALAAIAFLVKHEGQLGITLINDYLHGKHGRTWKCDRQAWLVHSSPVLGPARGHWLHVEIDAWAADDAATIARVWSVLPKP